MRNLEFNGDIQPFARRHGSDSLDDLRQDPGPEETLPSGKQREPAGSFAESDRCHQRDSADLVVLSRLF